MAAMKVFISVDMEGVAGIVHVDQTRASGQDFFRAREAMTAEANAAALGAFDAGATEVVINDSHADMRNLLVERLDQRVQVISGNLKPLSMAQGLEERYDAALFVGYHAGMGAKAGILDHTYHGGAVADVKVNGRRLNETGLNGLVAGARGTPVVLVTGDDRCCAEARDTIPEVETVTVKWAISRYCARSLHPAEAQKRIREGAIKALRRRAEIPPFKMDAPYTLELTFQNAGMADKVELLPRSTRLDGVRVEYTAADPSELFRALLASLALASASIPEVRGR